jgi:hypothetical protein
VSGTDGAVLGGTRERRASPSTLHDGRPKPRRARESPAPRGRQEEMNERPYASLDGVEIDEEILPLVIALRSSPAILTIGSCCGHSRKNAYIDLAVEGLAGLHLFVQALNRVDEKFSEDAFIDVGLNWSREVVTACDFGQFPDWVMLSMTMRGVEGPPSKKLLKRLAAAFERKLRVEQ